MTLRFKIAPLVMHAATPFRISRSTQTEVQNLLLTVQADGVTGYGEAVPTDYYGETPEIAHGALAGALHRWRGALPENPDELAVVWEDLESEVGAVSALAAIDMALWDWAARRARQPVWRFCGQPVARGITSSVTVAIGPLDQMAQKASGLRDYPIIKVKLGTDDDLRIVRTLRGVYGGRLRVDANCAWDAETTVKMAFELDKLGVEFIEQPMPPELDADMPDVRKESPLPVVADESCVGEGDVERCAGRFDGINIKLVKCGGLTPGLRMVERARTLGLGVMVGCMLESNVGIAAAAVVGGLADWADLDGSWLLADDPFGGHAFEQGAMQLSEAAGLGARPA